MSVYRAEIAVMLRPVINDPQGLSVRAGLRGLGFTGILGVRVGKLVSLELEADDEASARAGVQEMCRRLLANPVLEDWRIDSLDAVEPASP